MNANIRGTGKAIAISFEGWGEEVKSLDDARIGDIVVLLRFGANHYKQYPKDWRRHVGFLVSVHGAQHNVVRLLGGNQHDMVCECDFPARRISAIRRPLVTGVTQA